ncbi:hypothetical protein MMC25_002263 [Agyrium rufum]|nr:hypothetical protein [Agyrium rufum]
MAKDKSKKKSKTAEEVKAAEKHDSPQGESDVATLTPTANEAQSFDSWYLQAVTKEFADDIEKIRNAKDFKADSLPILIYALQQGASLYTDEEKARVTGRTKGAEK